MQLPTELHLASHPNHINYPSRSVLSSFMSWPVALQHPSTPAPLPTPQLPLLSPQVARLSSYPVYPAGAARSRQMLRLSIIEALSEQIPPPVALPAPSTLSLPPPQPFSPCPRSRRLRAQHYEFWTEPPQYSTARKRWEFLRHPLQASRATTVALPSRSQLGQKLRNKVCASSASSSRSDAAKFYGVNLALIERRPWVAPCSTVLWPVPGIRSGQAWN